MLNTVIFNINTTLSLTIRTILFTPLTMNKKLNTQIRIERYCNTLASHTTRYATMIELQNAHKIKALSKWTESFATKQVRYWQQSLKGNTVLLKARRLKLYFDWEINQGLRKINPINMKAVPKVTDERAPQALTKLEAQKLLKQIPRHTWIGLRDRLAVSLMLIHGLRISSVISLKWDDVVLRNGETFINIWSKGGKLETKRLRNDVASLLWELNDKSFEART